MRIMLVAISFVLVACPPIFSESDCADTLISGVTSPDGKVVANLIRRDCGATTDYSNIVFLRKSDGIKEKDSIWGEKIYVLQGEAQISFAWNSSELRIKAPTSGKNVFLKRDEWAGVKISYE